MHTKEIGKNLYQVELDTGGIKQLICSYIINGSKPFLIESGPTSSVHNLLSALKELQIKPETIEYVAITHVHLDHGGGAGSLLKHLPNAKIIVHPRGAPHLVDPGRLWSSSREVLGYVGDIFGKPEPVPKERIISLTKGIFDLGNNGQLSVIETVGHASHNLSFFESFNDGIFPGDAAGTYLADCGVVVPTTPPPFYLDAALASLDRLIGFNPSWLYFSHFGKADNAVNRLRAYKAQLQLWADVAEAGVKSSSSFEQIRENIILQDPVMNQVIDYVKEHPVYKKTVLENCIRGFVEYAKSKLNRL